MRKQIKIVLILTINILLSNCAAFGSKTIFKDTRNSFVKPNTIGFSQLEQETIMNKIIAETSDIHNRTMSYELKKRDIESKKVVYLNSQKWTNINKQEISDICAKNNFDGFIFTKLIFISTKHSMMFMSIGKSLDTEVEMQYFDSKGNLLLHIRHNTKKGNSYMDLPNAEKTIPDGIKGALKRIFKEMELN